MKLLKIMTLTSCALVLSSCSSQSMPLEQAAKECRPPGDWTWTNFLDARLWENTLTFDQIDLNGNQLDPDPICVLRKLGADETVVKGVTSATTNQTYGAEWDDITVESQSVVSGDQVLYNILITKK
ncbi:MAG: hypothetical protein EBZ61_03405 [Micrococcales bacterium]|nr:hypothetical protein [Micrococcales bacterium]